MVDPLVCPKCGADLDVPDGVAILTCKYCKSKLQLRETESVRALMLFDKKLDLILEQTTQAAVGVDRLKQDRRQAYKNWESQRDKLADRRVGKRNNLNEVEIRRKHLSEQNSRVGKFVGPIAALVVAAGAVVVAALGLGAHSLTPSSIAWLVALDGLAGTLVWGVGHATAAERKREIAAELAEVENTITELQTSLARVIEESSQWQLHEPPKPE